MSIDTLSYWTVSDVLYCHMAVFFLHVYACVLHACAFVMCSHHEDRSILVLDRLSFFNIGEKLVRMLMLQTVKQLLLPSEGFI